MSLHLHNPPPELRKPATHGGRARRANELGCTVSEKPDAILAENSFHCKSPDTRDAFAYWRSLPVIQQHVIDWLVAQDVPPLALGSGDNEPLKQADNGEIAILISAESGPLDVALWSARSGTAEALRGAAWAIGQDTALNPDVTALGGSLRIHKTPLQWLQANRRGIVILRWEGAFDGLRFVERVSLSKSLAPAYRQAMRPRCPILKIEG